ncbi:hypothetical protein T11_14498 [Trichinella zimbabwensis]|uniref:Uncharacterized protein n=1 Tax=Trichinella zimbabwensis TaxID=268475 RepID=A0A0V1I5J3_9BILA|nr:hypothetical protein T11_14498 [Trichinella zimbabwensis]
MLCSVRLNQKMVVGFLLLNVSGYTCCMYNSNDDNTEEQMTTIFKISILENLVKHLFCIAFDNNDNNNNNNHMKRLHRITMFVGTKILSLPGVIQYLEQCATLTLYYMDICINGWLYSQKTCYSAMLCDRLFSHHYTTPVRMKHTNGKKLKVAKQKLIAVFTNESAQKAEMERERERDRGERGKRVRQRNEVHIHMSSGRRKSIFRTIVVFFGNFFRRFIRIRNWMRSTLLSPEVGFFVNSNVGALFARVRTKSTLPHHSFQAVHFNGNFAQFSPEWFDTVGQCHLDFLFGQSERFQMATVVAVVGLILLLTVVVVVLVAIAVGGAGTMTGVGVAVGVGVGARCH